MARVVAVERRPHLTGALVAGDVVVGADAGTLAGSGVALSDLALASDVPDVGTDTPGLGGTGITDNALVRGHGTDSVQGSDVTLSDTGTLARTGAIAINPSTDLTLSVGATRTLKLWDGANVWLSTSAGGALSLSGQSIDVWDGTSQVKLDSNGVSVSSGASRAARVEGGTAVSILDGEGYGLFTAAGVVTLRSESDLILDGAVQDPAGDQYLRGRGYRLPASVAIHDTSLVAVTSAIPLRAGRRYQLRGTILVDSPSADDLKIQLSTTGTITGMITVDWGSSVQTLALDTPTGLIPTGGVQELKEWFGYAYCTVAGTIQLFAAKQVDSDGTATTVYADGTTITAIMV